MLQKRGVGLYVTFGEVSALIFAFAERATCVGLLIVAAVGVGRVVVPVHDEGAFGAVGARRGVRCVAAFSALATS